MEPTPADIARRRIVIGGLIVGPTLLLASNAFIVPESPDGMRAGFDAMGDAPWILFAQSLLMAIGFAVSLACYAGAPMALRRRGGTLGTWGAALSVLGIVGFTLSAAGGFFLYILTRMPDHEAGFAAAQALDSDDATGIVIIALSLAGEVGICLVIAGLWRAHIIPVWPLVIVVAGIVADSVLDSFLASLVADALLLAASVWVAIALRRSARADGAAVPA